MLLKSLESNYFKNSTLDLWEGLREALRRPWNILPRQPLNCFQAPQSQSHLGRVQRSQTCFLFYCNLPASSPRYPKTPFNKHFSILHIYKGGSHLVKYLSLIMAMQCSQHSENNCPYSLHPVSHTSHWCLLTNCHPRSQLPVVFWLLCHKF